jgi:GNAT superfamily N-acetyltransferase
LAVEVPDAVRRVALFPETDLHPFPTGHPTRRFTVAGVAVRLTANFARSVVFPERLDESRVEHVVDEVRRFLRDEGQEQGVWIVPKAALPLDLSERLRALGMASNDQPPFEPRGAAMVALEAPPPGPPELKARRAKNFDEVLAAQLTAADAFGVDEETRRAYESRAERLWKVERENGSVATFVALIDGDVVAFAGAHFGQTAVWLSGGGTRPDQRGRGAYRALVRARWDAANERGTPVLTVSAGAMSRPILERLGFSIVGWYDCLRDDLTS